MRIGFYQSLFVASLAVTVTEAFKTTADEIDDQFAEVDAMNNFNSADYLPHVGNVLIQVAHNEESGLSKVLAQTKAIVDNYIATMPAQEQERFENLYAQTRDLGFNWLGQAQKENREHVGQMLSQTEYGKFFLS